MTAEPCAPGVLRRRWSLGLTHLRALEGWRASDSEGNEIPWFSLRSQVLGEFAAARRRRR